jgi:predicted PurR-regulated permease PerM
MAEIAIPVIVFGIILIIALIIIAVVYSKLIPSLSDYLNNLIKRIPNAIICALSPFC